MTVTLLLAQATGLQAIRDANGFGIAITGMLIVFTALSIISLFIRFLPILLEYLDPYLPQVTTHHAPSVAERMPSEDQRIVAAIGYVLHEEMKKAATSNN